MRFIQQPHPGDLLQSFLDDAGLTIEDFSLRSGLDQVSCRKLLESEDRIDAERALAIAKALGTTPELWTNIQTSCDLMQRRQTLLRHLGAENSGDKRYSALTNLVRIATLEGPGTKECCGVWLDLGSRVHQLAEIFTSVPLDKQLELAPIFSAIIPSDDARPGKAALRMLGEAFSTSSGEQAQLYQKTIELLELRLSAD